MKQLQLTHTVLYFKGWYKVTDILEDLKKTLNADGYSPMNLNDVMLSLVARMEDTEHHRINAFSVLNAMKQKEWRYKWNNEENYTYQNLVIDYMAELIIGLGNKQWKIGKPDYSILPAPKHHKGNEVENMFGTLTEY